MTEQGIPEQGTAPSALDWAEVRRRVDESAKALERALDVTPERRGAVLKARAKALARVAADDVEAGERIEVVEFVVAHEMYAIESRYVREVHPMKLLTPVPSLPPFVLGIVSVRGRMLSVMDLKKLFGLPDKGLADVDRLVIVGAGDMELAILADSVAGVRSIPLASVRPALPSLTGIRANYLKGITDERSVILDAGKLLADDSIIVDDRVDV